MMAHATIMSWTFAPWDRWRWMTSLRNMISVSFIVTSSSVLRNFNYVTMTSLWYYDVRSSLSIWDDRGPDTEWGDEEACQDEVTGRTSNTRHTQQSNILHVWIYLHELCSQVLYNTNNSSKLIYSPHLGYSWTDRALWEDWVSLEPCPGGEACPCSPVQLQRGGRETLYSP